MPLTVWSTAFLLGAIPFGYLVARAVAGVDIRTVGDGNPGGRNVYLHVNRAAGIAVTLLDIAKGTAAILIARVSGLVGVRSHRRPRGGYQRADVDGFVRDGG